MLDWVWLWALGAHGGYDIVSIDVSKPEPTLSRTEYVVQAGNDSLNRFSITRVAQRRNTARKARSRPVVLLSPFLLPGAFYEISETGHYADSLAGRLASDHYDVWLVDQRRSDLAPGSCESGAFDCSVMLDWDLYTYSSDALFAAALARSMNHGQKPVLGGFSAGSNVALATINRAPHFFSDLVLYEGTSYTEDPTISEHNLAACTTLESLIDSGLAYDPSARVFGAVIGLAALDPAGPSPIPSFPPGTTNQQALLYVFSAPPPPGALSPTPNFVRMIADFDSQQFVYSNQDRLTLVGPLFDNYAPLAALRDLACGLAGVDASHHDNLGRFRGDVLMFVGGTGFGQAMFDTADLFTGARSLRIEYRPELGEADFYFHEQWQEEFYEPLATWLP
jgi:hypothetical protein